MNITTTIHLKLSQKEAAALRKLLGSLSINDKTDHLLTPEECAITSDIFVLLPPIQNED